ncbi:amidohydrolase family protein [Niabella hibiscisoli]|uniref:amidohydrolase family protein n=1 Tax=Niabella hibiscisoli TaxID=1825928 RepID=UPI001F0F1CDB|nr:amidohydrolase family protein [Niabella hibiscisoli]MCH5717048.1 amidohydrolase family protein [Niabella hibiscisoli]
MVDGYYRDGAGNLGGAAISMIDAVKNAMAHLNVTLQEAIEMATSRVAKAIKMDDRIGFIQPGYDARFVLFDDDLNSVEFLAGNCLNVTFVK